jgi:hypothetical protein
LRKSKNLARRDLHVADGRDAQRGAGNCRVDHSRLSASCAVEVLNAPAWDWLQNRF